LQQPQQQSVGGRVFVKQSSTTMTARPNRIRMQTLKVSEGISLGFYETFASISCGIAILPGFLSASAHFVSL
jgi:hypothetical protein